MYAPIPSNGHLTGLTPGGYTSMPLGMGAAATADANAVSRCKMAYITMKGCDPDLSWWDWLTAERNGPECVRQQTAYFTCLAASLPLAPGAGPAPQSAVDPSADPNTVWQDQQASDSDSLAQWFDAVRGTLTGPDPDPTTSGVPWGWIALGAGAFILLRRL